jgi:hypothetical protein
MDVPGFEERGKRESMLLLVKSDHGFPLSRE